MGFSKWIGASIGWSFGGPIGAIIGMAVGSLLDASSKGGSSNSQNQATTRWSCLPSAFITIEAKTNKLTSKSPERVAA